MIYLIKINRTEWNESFDYFFDSSADAFAFYEQERGNCMYGDKIVLYECNKLDTCSIGEER